MVRVLHVFHNMGNGGIEHFVMDFYRRIDREKIQFDFLTSVDEPGYFDEEIIALGGRLYRAFPFKKNPVKNYFDIARIVKDNGYDIVHRHTGSAFGYFDLRAARKGGAKNLIIHSHNPQAGNPLVHVVCSKLLQFDCIRFACSQEAGEFLFNGRDFTIIKNAIDCQKYSFDAQIRKKMRENLKLGDAFVVGHVGRFEEQKNHQKLIEIFYEIRKKNPNSTLVCVGDGSMIRERIIQAKELGIYESVRFLGSRDDVEDVIQTFDVFCFPSLYEGFSITLIEAQVNGLKCFASKERVPSASNITGNIEYVGLEEVAEKWADTILNSDYSRDLDACSAVREAGYDINQETMNIQEFYLGLE